jgi:hypothetical protein
MYASIKGFFSFSELYDYCLKEKIADGNLIAKWKKLVTFFVNGTED